MPNPYGKPRTSAKDLKMIGQIVVNWSYADHCLGRVLEDVIYRQTGPNADDLIYPLDTRKKSDLIKKRRKALPASPEIDHVISELKYACEEPRKKRNMAAHGKILFHPDGQGFLFSRQNDGRLRFDELPHIVEWSRYVATISKRLWLLAHGASPHDALPQRPSAPRVPSPNSPNTRRTPNHAARRRPPSPSFP
jgi:hypothetical protein